MKTDRKGFLAGLMAAVVAPFVPEKVAEPEPKKTEPMQVHATGTTDNGGVAAYWFTITSTAANSVGVWVYVPADVTS